MHTPASLHHSHPLCEAPQNRNGQRRRQQCAQPRLARPLPAAATQALVCTTPARMTHDRWCDVCINTMFRTSLPAARHAYTAWHPQHGTQSMSGAHDRPCNTQPQAIPDTHTPGHTHQANFATCCTAQQHSMAEHCTPARTPCEHHARRLPPLPLPHSLSYYCKTPSTCTACFCRSLRPYGMHPA